MFWGWGGGGLAGWERSRAGMNRLGWAGAGLWDVGGWSRLAGLGIEIGCQ